MEYEHTLVIQFQFLLLKLQQVLLQLRSYSIQSIDLVRDLLNLVVDESL